jgi:hypothetical protein
VRWSIPTGLMQSWQQCGQVDIARLQQFLTIDSRMNLSAAADTNDQHDPVGAILIPTAWASETKFRFLRDGRQLLTMRNALKEINLKSVDALAGLYLGIAVASVNALVAIVVVIGFIAACLFYPSVRPFQLAALRKGADLSPRPSGWLGGGFRLVLSCPLVCFQR